jgi:phage terminase large subunit-like protein
MVPDALSGGPHFAAFCERYIRHTKGRWAGRPLLFEEWQREFWWEALELDPATGLRIYSEVGLGIPRKNGKSTMASAAAHYFLIADGEAEPEVYIGAAARHQAGIVLGQARTMAYRSARLLDRVIVRRYSVECPSNGGVMRAVASDSALQHGLNPSANVIDELWAHKDAGLYTALTTGTGAREQPFTLWISTAGPADVGILPELYASMFEGGGELERRDSLLIYRDRPNGVLMYWYGAARDADIADLAVWRGCNPASWLRDGPYLVGQYARLKARGALLAWRMYHLNQFAGLEASWLPDGAWSKCTDARLQNGQPEHPLRVDLPVGVGVYKAAHSDAAAIVVAQRQGDRVVLRSRPFGVEAATGRVSAEAMRSYLRELRTTYPLPQARDAKTKRALPGPAIAFERWSFTESADELETEGLTMVDFPQHAGTMGPASTMAFELATTGRLIHDGDPVLAEHVAATNALLTDRGMKVVPRREGPRRNHAAIAAVMAIAMAMQEAPKPGPSRQMRTS